MRGASPFSEMALLVSWFRRRSSPPATAENLLLFRIDGNRTPFSSAAGGEKMGIALAAGSQADSPKSWTTPWSNAFLNQQNGHHWELADNDQIPRTLVAAVEIFGTGTPAADHGVVRDDGVAFVDICRCTPKHLRHDSESLAAIDAPCDSFNGEPRETQKDQKDYCTVGLCLTLDTWRFLGGWWRRRHRIERVETCNGDLGSPGSLRA